MDSFCNLWKIEILGISIAKLLVLILATFSRKKWRKKSEICQTRDNDRFSRFLVARTVANFQKNNALENTKRPKLAAEVKLLTCIHYTPKREKMQVI
ncbi:MAG: hypothetical protein A3J07_03160 [Candidatus Doudnabacteria bacterium RIFCSPLOWO2_02_FULL_49_13]|uniref:Uncharacterized protein n=1 Tax=Candidatus Doudnabacteria bacterium RIFCSPHIGHO2_12_FULL_48_16 TaxID=1817838 RepID=A0A1F5PIJ5_9BACT|nr:MAG: hypothetical protein A3B77_01965 [Candidatus Doudnabacteria bacterium RIFCSPHIGHO2_02_FULL_49_24]OGE89010.1 MAG: hypothetical protein A2760_00085 [Candidatus Doudnabacteria bacterium RIFCSPHIGHO2_01_FULL_50_67]OGE89699.1 MAG: hypothetical protein A3E29_00590 [Candidatus Doudnabacteria bacterium RIFCSPHIGHO2_12_FULL_48_16]OGE97533.1 MAG: hypothetical protein A2990_02330 [Candidatus Doudnabacteria bacterium RIFCSPLOWO2_01_FULL_49_40]OGF03063.1 MAG: hypothetical protein A3J07_03160 [Candid